MSQQQTWVSHVWQRSALSSVTRKGMSHVTRKASLACGQSRRTCKRIMSHQQTRMSHLSICAPRLWFYRNVILSTHQQRRMTHDSHQQNESWVILSADVSHTNESHMWHITHINVTHHTYKCDTCDTSHIQMWHISRMSHESFASADVSQRSALSSVTEK